MENSTKWLLGIAAGAGLLYMLKKRAAAQAPVAPGTGIVSGTTGAVQSAILQAQAAPDWKLLANAWARNEIPQSIVTPDGVPVGNVTATLAQAAQMYNNGQLYEEESAALGRLVALYGVTV